MKDIDRIIGNLQVNDFCFSAYRNWSTLNAVKRKGKALLPANPNAGIDEPYPFSQINN